MIENYDNTNLQDFEYEKTAISNGNIIGTCELGKATIKLINNSNKYSSLKDTWIKTIHGSFFIYDVKPVQEKINIQLDCYDIKYKLDKKYNKEKYESLFPTTLKVWRNAIYDDCDVDYDNSDFPNSDLVLDKHPYVEEDTSNRNVLCFIAQAGCSWIDTDENDIFYFRWFEDLVYMVTDWLDLTTEKELTKAVNLVTLGRGDVEDNVTYPTKEPENKKEFRIDNNYILDPQDVELEEDRRYSVIQPIYNRINGLQYIVMSIRTQDIKNKLSIKLGQKIQYTDIWENELETYIMKKKIKYIGGDPTIDDNYEITLSTEEINETSSEFKYSSSVPNQILDVNRKCDKLSGVIEDTIKKVDENKEEITKVTQTSNEIKSSVDNLNKDYELNMTTSKLASGNPIIIENAGEYYIDNLEIEGKIYQEKKNGYQLFDSSLIDFTMQSDSEGNGVALINNLDGSFTISKEGTGVLSSAFSTYTNYSHEKTIEMLKPGNIYIKYDEKTKPYVLLQLRAENTIFFEVNNYSDNHASGNVTQEMLDNPSTILRIGFFCPKNATVTPTTIWPMFYQDGNGDWEKFTGGKPMPNLDFKSEIKTVKGINNLCNIVSVSPKSYSNGLPAGDVQALKVESFNSNNINFYVTGNGNYIALTNVLELEPLTDYILSYERTDIIANANSRHYIYSVDSNNNYAIISNALSGDAGKKEIVFKTTLSGKVAFGFGFAANANNSKTEIKDIKIEKGIESHEYVPHGSWLLNKTHNKNFFNKNNVTNNFRIGIDGNLTSSGTYCVSEYIEVIPKQEYVFNKTRTALYNRITFYSKDYEILGVESTADNVVTTPENTKYLRFGWLKDDISNLQLEEGDSSTDYEEFKENKVLIDLNIYNESNNIVGHHELGEINNLKDLYKYGILTKKINKIVFNGTENWAKNTSASTVNGYYEFSTTITDKPSKQVLLMCDSLQVGNAYNDSKEQIRNRTDKQIYINIKGNRLENQDVAGFKKYLSENNITVYYEIDPKTYELNYERLKLFKDYNYITLNDKLLPNMNIKYLTDSNLNGQFVTHAEHKITSDSITSSLNKTIKDTKNETIEEVNVTIDEKIVDSEANINLEVSKKINTAKTEAINSANNTTTNKLKDYPKTTDVNAKLELKVGKDDNDQVTSMLNASAMEINISGNRFILEADNISIDKYGNLICQNAKIRGGDLILNDDGTSENAALKIKNGDTNRYTYYTATGILADLTCDYNFTMDDIKNIQNYILEKGDLSKDQFEMYDLNKDGVVDGKDMLRVQAYILSGISKTKPGKFILNTDSFRDNLQIIDGSGNSIVSIGLNGIYENGKKFKKEHGQQTLWNGSYYMHGSQEITLSENISDQENGIVLVFSHFNNSSLNADDYWFEMKFIPKSFVKDFPGCGVDFMFTNATFGTVGSKYLYIADNKIKGHADNQKTGTGTSGIKYDNSQWVLRKVIGV